MQSAVFLNHHWYYIKAFINNIGCIFQELIDPIEIATRNVIN